MRLAAAAVVTGALLLPAGAGAAPKDGTYTGAVTTGQGGTVTLTVSGGGSTVNAAFQGLGNVAGTCTGVGFETGDVPVEDQFFEYSNGIGAVTASGTFTPSFVTGSAQALQPSSPCNTNSQSWVVDGPDATLGDDPAFTGLGVLNATGEDQTDSVKAKRGEKVEIPLAFFNQGQSTTSFLLKGCKSSKGFKVTYGYGGFVATDEVTSGELETRNLAPSHIGVDFDTLDVFITPLKSAKAGQTKSCKVTQSSELLRDVVKAEVKVKRG